MILTQIFPKGKGGNRTHCPTLIFMHEPFSNALRMYLNFTTQLVIDSIAHY
jgi:hypothetical protein